MIDKQDFLFGLRQIIEAIRSGKEMDKVLIKKGLSGDLYHELMGLIRSDGMNLCLSTRTVSIWFCAMSVISINSECDYFSMVARILDSQEKRCQGS